MYCYFHRVLFVLCQSVFLLAPLTAIAADRDSHASENLFDRILDRIEPSASFELESATNINDGSSQKLEMIFEPEFNIRLPAGLDLTAIGRLRSDTFDDFEPGRPALSERSEFSRRIMVGDRVDLELREFYLNADVGRTLLTVGKQQIVWGKADGLKVMDVVNPQDFREFIMDEFEDSRIPLWSVNAEIPISDLTLQLVWVPDQTYHELPEAGSPYNFTSPLLIPTPPAGVDVAFNPVDRPNRVFADSDAGARLSTFWKGWDLTANYFYHYNDLPVFLRDVSMTPEGARVTITPTYERSHLLGGTFSNAFGDLTVRGEVAFFFDRFFSTNDGADADGVVKTNELFYVNGFDWYGFTDTLLSVQVFQSIVTNNTPELIRDPIDTDMSFLARRSFLNETLMVETLWIQDVNRGDGMLRPKLSYDLSDGIKVWAGVDVFYGTRNGLFGQFGENDRVLIGVEWGF